MMTNDICNKVSDCDDVMKLLRIQRHDFLNHLQVIHALVQLGRGEKALKYIEKLAQDPELVSNVISTYKQQVK